MDLIFKPVYKIKCQVHLHRIKLKICWEYSNMNLVILLNLFFQIDASDTSKKSMTTGLVSNEHIVSVGIIFEIFSRTKNHKVLIKLILGLSKTSKKNWPMELIFTEKYFFKKLLWIECIIISTELYNLFET